MRIYNERIKVSKHLKNPMLSQQLCPIPNVKQGFINLTESAVRYRQPGQVDRRRLPSMQQTGDPDVLCRRSLAINNVLSDLRLLLFADGCFLLSNNLRMSPGRRFKLVTAFSSDYDVGQLCAKVKM